MLPQLNNIPLIFSSAQIQTLSLRITLTYVPMSPLGKISESLLQEMAKEQINYHQNVRRIVIITESKLFIPTWEYSAECVGYMWCRKLSEATARDNYFLFMVVDSGLINNIYAFTEDNNYEQALQWMATFRKEIQPQITNIMSQGISEENTIFDSMSRHTYSVTSAYASVLKHAIPRDIFHRKCPSTNPPEVQRCKLVFLSSASGQTSSVSTYHTHIPPQHNITTPQRSNMSPTNLSDITDSQGPKISRIITQIHDLSSSLRDATDTIVEMKLHQEETDKLLFDINAKLSMLLANQDPPDMSGNKRDRSDLKHTPTSIMKSLDLTKNQASEQTLVEATSMECEVPNNQMLTGGDT